MNTEKMFEIAGREKLRFQTTKGAITVEELWDLSLTSLDNVAKNVNACLRTSSEESFIPKKATRASKAQKLTELSLEILKYVIQTKVDEADAAKAKADKSAKAARLRELLAQKDEEELVGKSKEELKTLLAEMEG